MLLDSEAADELISNFVRRIRGVSPVGNGLATASNFLNTAMDDTNDTENQEAEVPAHNEKMGERDLGPKLMKLYQKADSALETANYGYAISLLQAILAQQPAFLTGRRKLRSAAVRQKDAAKKSLNLGGDSIKVMKLQGQAKKDPAGAIVAVEKEVLATDPYNPQANLMLYEAAAATGLKLTAGFALETLTTGHPDNNKYWHQLGAYYLEQEEFEEAAKIYMQIRQRDPADLVAIQNEKNATARQSMKSQNWEGGSFEELKKDSAEATKLDQAERAGGTPEMKRARVAELGQEYAADQNNIDVSKELAKLYAELEQWPESLQFYEWAYSLSNRDPSLERKVAQITEKKIRAEMAELQAFIDENPDHADVEQYKARIVEMNSEQNEQLIEEARIRVERNPTDPQLRFDYGQHLFNGAKFRESIKHLQQAKVSPNLRLQTMLMLGKCYEKMNILDIAAQQFSEAAKEVPGMDDLKKDLLYNLGLLYEKMGKKEESLDALKQIYSADYGYKDVADRVEGSYMDGDDDAAATA